MNYTNPFQITAPVEPAEVIDRSDEVTRLRALAEEGNSARLVAPRRFGKTSLLNKVQVELADAGWIVVYVDLSGITTTDDFVNRLEEAYNKALKGSVARWFAARRRTLRPKVTVGGGPVPGSIETDLSGVPPALLALLDLPREVAKRSDSRVHVVLDEFQDLLTISPDLDSIVRSRIQHHGKFASYVFAGSQVTMMEELFTNRKRAFYGQAMPVALRPLSDEALGDYIAERFESTERELEPDALRALLDVVSGHPQRGMLAAHELWNDATDGIADLEAWGRAYEAVMRIVDDEFRRQWNELKPAEKRALRAVATGGAPYSADLPPSQRGKAVSTALTALTDRGLITGAGKNRSLVDPFFKDWIEAQQ